MGTTNISNTKNPGDVIDETWYNDFRSALIGALLSRDASSGAVGGESDLGAALTPWGNVYANGLIINGAAINFDAFATDPNAILSGKVRSTSNFPDFILANGAAPSFQVLGAVTNLILNINNQETTVSTDITESGLTLAPSTNNTCLVNDPSLSGGAQTKYQGEDGTVITIDAAGTEITNRIGQYAIFKTSTEYMLAYINSATELTNVYRGFLFDSSGNPIQRVPINDDDVLTIMSSGWTFIENDGLTVDVTYNSPVYAYTEPSSPVVGDYWFDRINETWKRYNGSAFVIIDRTLIGIVAIDTVNCIASRSFNFNNDFNSFNSVSLKYISATIIEVTNYDFVINVYGQAVINQVTKYEWDIATDLESGQIEAANTIYYAYITDEGKPTLSDIKPYNQKGELSGWYHPYNAWRAIGNINNDGSSDFDSSTLIEYGSNITITNLARDLLDDPTQDEMQLTMGVRAVPHIEVFTSSGVWIKPADVDYIKVTIIGGGGSGEGTAGDGNQGGSSSFGAFCSATGGNGGSQGTTGGDGGVGSGGDLNPTGGRGGVAGDGSGEPEGEGGVSVLGAYPTYGAGSDSDRPLNTGDAFIRGGGAGGAAIKIINVTGNVNFTIGAGGAVSQPGTATAGADGVLVVEYNSAT